MIHSNTHSRPQSALMWVVLVMLSFSLDACKDPEDAPSEDLTFAPALQHYQNVIYSRYQDVHEASIELENEVSLFHNSPTADGLDLVREALRTSWIKWQYAAPYGMGPAATLETHSKVNTFPTDTVAINTRISTADWSGLAFDEQGFPALDYLLNAHNFEDFSTGSDAENLLNFVAFTAQQLQENLHELTTGWEAYAGTFTSQTGASATGSMSQFVNSFIVNFEQLKRDKIALPLGLLTLDIPLPERVECYFGGYSSELANHHLQGVSAAYKGIDITGTEGLGLDDLLNDEDAFHEGSSLPLDTYIRQEIEEAATALNAVPDPLHETILNNPQVVEEAYLELQQLVVLFKADLPSYLGISITFTDNDGD